jgi:hypothetical protein
MKVRDFLAFACMVLAVYHIIYGIFDSFHRLLEMSVLHGSMFLVLLVAADRLRRMSE